MNIPPPAPPGSTHHPACDPDVIAAAAKYNLDPYPIQAIVIAEGNIVRAVQCTYPDITDRPAALDVVCRSFIHAMRDYIETIHVRTSFVLFLANRWAPLNAKNDPNHLNDYWPKNVLAAWSILGGETHA